MLQLILLTAIVYLRGLRPGFSKTVSKTSTVVYRCLLAILLCNIIEAVFNILYFGKYHTPETPAPIFWGHVILTACLVFGSGVILIRDAANLLYLFVCRKGKAPHSVSDWGADPRCAWATLAVTCLVATYAYHEARHPPITQHVTLSIKGLPRAFSGFKIVQLSDLHVFRLTRDPELQQLVCQVNAIEPDLIVLTGDIADGALNFRKQDLLTLKQLKAPFGVLGCEGNHEHYMDFDKYKAFYPELGIHWLRNTHRVLEKNGETIVVAGLTDKAAEDFEREEPDLEKALTGAPSVPIILLSHQPSDARAYANHPEIKLMLSGHTHGGQILGPSIYAWARSNGFLSGLYRIASNTTHKTQLFLYVNPGSYFFPSLPFRLGTRNEITCFTLERTP